MYVLNLDERQMQNLRYRIDTLLSQYQYNSQGCDYSCAFCGAMPRTNVDPQPHLPDCVGVQLLQQLDEALVRGPE